MLAKKEREHRDRTPMRSDLVSKGLKPSYSWDRLSLLIDTLKTDKPNPQMSNASQIWFIMIYKQKHIQ